MLEHLNPKLEKAAKQALKKGFYANNNDITEVTKVYIALQKELRAFERRLSVDVAKRTVYTTADDTKILIHQGNIDESSL